MSRPNDADGVATEVDAWAASGAMELTGRAGQVPLGPPAGLVPELRRLEAHLLSTTATLGRPVAVDALALLGERAAFAGLERRGATSCGRGTQLLRARDGWLAVSLARPEDLDLVPAWLGLPAPVDDAWGAVADAGERSTVGELVDRGILLGLPIAALPPAASRHVDPRPVRSVSFGSLAPARTLSGLVVVDLSSLWAGPLCGSLLAAAGADVIKVESTRRPDGARLGPSGFYHLLNAGKRRVTLDLQDPAGVHELAALLQDADVVIEASRPRALEQLGIHTAAVLRTGRARVWTSITAHGRFAAPNRVGFGDDAAVAGGLVCWDDEGPCFCADAIADPLTGLVAATAVVDQLQQGGRCLLDVSMAHVAARFAGPTLPVGPGVRSAAPHARSPVPQIWRC